MTSSSLPNDSAYLSMESYLREHNDNALAAAGAYAYDRWKRGEHPQEAESAAVRAFALTDDEAAQLAKNWHVGGTR